MERLSLHNIRSDYRSQRDIETALAWNAIKKTLSELGRDDLFGYIKSVRVTEKNMVITTGKPLINNEIKLYSSSLISSFNTSSELIGSCKKLKLVIM